MSTSLVREAYEDMLKKHSDSLRQSSVYIHHDQGSQYLSTSFQQLLNDGGFIQSVSARGNSQDNSPMESFFGHLKRDILDLVARCCDFETARRVIDGYISDYNEKFYQYSLAGLTLSIRNDRDLPPRQLLWRIGKRNDGHRESG